MTIKAIMFDVDGTLVDSNDLHVLAWKQAFEAAGAGTLEAELDMKGDAIAFSTCGPRSLT